MLEPNNKTIHTILQPLKEVNLSCHVLPILPKSIYIGKSLFTKNVVAVII